MKKVATSTSYTYETIAMVFVMTLLLSNILSIKPVQVGPAVFDAGTILFPLAYIIGDVVTEVYGFRRMQRMLIIGCLTLVAMSVLFWIVGSLPAVGSWGDQASYDAILGVVWRISMASILAIFIGELVNAYVLSYMKVKFAGKNLWGRLIGSTAIGDALDTVVFSFLAFFGTMPATVLVQLMITVYFIKLGTEIVISPLTILLINTIKRRENIDVYEKPSLI